MERVGTMTRFSYDENQSQRRVKNPCNSQICFAYLLSVLAVGLIVGGMYLSYIHWEKLWLILAVIGIVINLFGSCFYYSGTKQSYHRNEEHIYENRTRRRRYRNRGLSTDQLMPSAPPLNQSRSISQLSLNMIPQYFCSNESEAISLANTSNAPSVSPLTSFSQIFSVNGQSYLILPLTGEPLNASNSFPLQNLVVKVSEDNKLQNANQTTNEMRDKKGREEQSSQTENISKDIKYESNRYRDVQLQTLSRTQLDQIDNEVVNHRPHCSQSTQMTQSTSATNSGSYNVDMSSNDCSSNESPDNSLEPFGSEGTETIVTLIDLNDDNNQCTTSETNRRSGNIFDNRLQQNPSHSLMTETVVRVEECFDSFTNENVCEEQIDETLSIPPPTYEDVVDSDDQPIVVDYGTL